MADYARFGGNRYKCPGTSVYIRRGRSSAMVCALLHVCPYRLLASARQRAMARMVRFVARAHSRMALDACRHHSRRPRGSRQLPHIAIGCRRHRTNVVARRIGSHAGRHQRDIGVSSRQTHTNATHWHRIPKITFSSRTGHICVRLPRNDRSTDGSTCRRTDCGNHIGLHMETPFQTQNGTDESPHQGKGHSHVACGKGQAFRICVIIP